MIITGSYIRTVYRDDKTGRTIFTFSTKDIKPYNITCLGSCQMYPAGMPLKLRGDIKNGEFHFTECIPYVNTREKMVNFLSSKTFSGIGEKTAEKIYDFIDGDIFEYAQTEDAEPELTERFDAAIAKEIVTKIRSLNKISKIYKYIEPFGGTMGAAIKIGKTATFGEFIENVYEIGRAGGLSFGCCDGIAKSLAYSPYDQKRVAALLAESTKRMLSSGSIYTDIRDITKRVKRACENSAFSEEIPAPLLFSLAHKSGKYRIKEVGGEIRYYPTYLDNAENAVSNGILKLQTGATPLPFDEKIIEEIENECGIKYSESQKKSFSLLKTSGVKILTGGPGTGKSTVVNGMVKAIKKMCPNEVPLLCAPTGRAAQRLKEVTGCPASTIHRALNIAPYGDDYVSVTPVDAKFIIVDEASMIDICLFDNLINALPDSALLLLCGDTEQLPSVGPGNVLKDMIASEKIEVATLDVVFRCLKDSLISLNAHKIRSGETIPNIGRDFHFFRYANEDGVRAKVEEIVRERHNPRDPFDLQVLCPVKDGEIGTKGLNKALQKICNEKSTAYTVFDSYKYKISDKIIMTRNNYPAGYLNGDVGIVKDIDDTTMLIELGDDKEIRLNRDDLSDVSPAYALTVHKSQGSEFATVIVVLPEKPIWMLQRNLLYTAITRAKKEVFVIAQKNAYAAAVRNAQITKRKTSLKEKLQKGVYIYG